MASISQDRPATASDSSTSSAAAASSSSLDGTRNAQQQEQQQQQQAFDSPTTDRNLDASEQASGRKSVDKDSRANEDNRGGLEVDASAAAAAPSDGENTPPMPNGDRRLHPLIDEEQIAHQKVAAVRRQRRSYDGDNDVHDARQDGDGGVASGGDKDYPTVDVDQAANDDDDDEAEQRRPDSHDAKSRPDRLRLLDSMENEPGYPSPSGGFVPPVTDESFLLSDPPAPRSSHAATMTSAAKGQQAADHAPSFSSFSAFPSSEDADHRAAVDDPSITASSPSQKTSTLQSSNADDAASTELHSPQAMRQSRLASSSSNNSLGGAGEGRRRHLSSTSSTSSGGVGRGVGSGSTHSQAISARSSPSTVAPARRRSSVAVDQLKKRGESTYTDDQSQLPEQDEAYDDDDGVPLPPLKIRDFAFSELDPRHVGARDVGLSAHSDDGRWSPSDEIAGGRMGTALGLGGGANGGGNDWSMGADGEYDEDEDDEDEYEGDMRGGANAHLSNSSSASSSATGAAGLPLGLYHAAYDFTAESEHELDVKVGQKVRLIGHVDGGWAIVVRVDDDDSKEAVAEGEKGEKGLVPEAYLQWLGQ